MPKQLGTYKVRGKMDGKSYYKPKNTEDYLFRSINQQMSERVKTEPKFAKTRAYAAEFGVCAELSKSIVSVFNRRFPNALARKSNAPLTKLFMDTLKQDQDNPLGQRQLIGYTWQDGVINHLNNMSKSKPSAGGVIFSGCSITVPSAQFNYNIDVALNISIAAGAFSYLRQIGADSVRVHPFYFLSFGSRYFPDWPGYSDGVAYIFRKGSHTIGVDDGYDFLNNSMQIPSVVWYGVYRPTAHDSSWQLSRPGLYFEPIKHIGSSEVILTQKCGFVLGAFITSYTHILPGLSN